MDPLIAGIIGTAVLLAAIFLGLHIAIALGIVGFLGLWLLTGSVAIALGPLSTASYVRVTTYEFIALPMFVVMGFFASYSGISDDTYDTFQKWVGRFPGGLAIATVIGNAVFGTVTGSSAVSVVVFTKVAMPQMLKYQYKKSLACGSILGGSLLGMLIPPSIIAVLYGIITDTSIAHLLMAGVGPGLLLVTVYSLMIYVMVRFNPSLAPMQAERFTLKTRLVSIKGLVPAFAVGLIVIGGMYTGIFCPTEAGAAASIVILLYAMVTKKMTWKKFVESIMETSQACAMYFMIVMLAVIFSRFLALTGIPVMFVDWVHDSGMPVMSMVGMFMIMYLVLGCFLDLTSMMFITLPIVHPVIVQLGLNPLWFAMLVILACELGALTPPVGLAIYNMKAVAKDLVEIPELFRASVPFMIGGLISLVIMMFYEPISVFIPNIMYGG